MAVNLPLAFPSFNDPIFDPSTQLTDQNPLDTGTSIADVPLSGDIPISTQSQQADTSAPSDVALPLAPSATTPQTGGPPSTMQLEPGQKWLGSTQAQTSQDSGPPPTMQLAPGQKWLGSNQRPLPQGQPASPTGPPAPTFGNDVAGSILSAERNLPGGTGTQAFVHGAQAQALPMAGAIGGGILGGALVGAAFGSAVPVVGTIAGGLVGGLIGYWLGEQVQNAAGNEIASQQTRDALKAQTDYEQQNYPLQYAAGGLAIQALTFHPKLSAIPDSFKLIGRVMVTPGVEAKLAELGLPGNQAALNQLIAMAWGGGQTAIQAKQQIDSGNFQPGLLALNLVGATVLSQPDKWLGHVVPQLRGPIRDTRDVAVQQIIESGSNRLDELASILKDNPTAVQLVNDQRARIEQINDAVSAGNREKAIPLIDEYGKVDQQLEQYMKAVPLSNKAVPEAQSEVAAEPIVTSGEQAPAVPEQSIAPLTPEQANAAIKAANESVREWTTAHFQQQRQLNKELPPEPRKETTPEGVSTGIRAAVEQHPAADAAFQALSPYGEVHVVGGAVRNMIAGKPIKDLDLTFSGTEDQLNEALSKIGDATVQKTGDQFPVYRLTLDSGEQVEIALHRTENPENQHAFATGTNIPIGEDLGRRDFTTNAMGVNIKTGVFQDPFNGLKHTQSKSLALVNKNAFMGDPVRMLRALRFIGDGYHANKSLLTSLKDNAGLIQDIPAERIQGELDRIFSSEKPGKALEAMKDAGVLDHIFPEHLKTIGFDQRSTHHNQLLWDHIMGVVNKVAELNPDPDVRMAAFLHDISKPATMVERPGTGGKMSYLGHEDKGAEVSQRILKSLKYPNDRIDRIVFLVKNHMFQQPRVLSHPAGFIHDMSKDLMSIPPADRQEIVNSRINDLFTIREADQANHPVNKADIKAMRAALESVGQRPLGRPASNIDGNDLIDMGLKPGPEFSRILRQLDSEVAEGQLDNVPETLINRAKELADGKTTLQARRILPFDQDPWPEVRRAILEHGGIGPNKDWPKEYIPADLYREKGKTPDLIANEVSIGRADVPPWGENASDNDMMKYVREAWEQHKKIQAGSGSYQPGEMSVRSPQDTHVNHIPVQRGNEEVKSIARYYANSTGLPAPTETSPVKVDPSSAARLAKWYENAKSDPTNPEVQAAYKAFNDETRKQWDLLNEAGYQIEPWTRPGQPYKNSAEMQADVRDNKHLYYFQNNDESQPIHELMTPDQNEKFRAVHDFFGHAMNGNQFGPNGEENAWVEHAKMYSPLAQKAMTTETRAQNSTVNFGAHGEANRANPEKTVYAEQKAVIPPKEFLPRQRVALTHYSAKPRTEIDPERQGESGLSSELNHIGANPNATSRFQSYYEGGQKPERFFGEGTAFPVKHTVTGDYRILDLSSPEAARIQREAIAKNQYGAVNKHEFDDAVEAAGFDGYKASGTVRLFGKQPVSHINDIPVTPGGATEFTARLGRGQGESNGIQQETTGQPETSGEAGVPGQISQASEAGNAGQVNSEGAATTGNETIVPGAGQPAEGPTALNVVSGVEGRIGGTETSSVYPSATGAGDFRPHAGDTARIDGATANATRRSNAFSNAIATGAVQADFSATAFAARNRAASQRGTTNVEQSAKAGSSGWASSSDVEEQFINNAHSIAESMGVDLTQAPQFRGGIRLLPEEHGELVRFSQKPNDETNAGNAPLNKVLLQIPDDPRLVPGAFMKDAKDWPTLISANKLVDQIRAHSSGNPSLEYLPAKITDDATRLALILKGWARRFFYDNARTFPDTINFDNSSPGAKARWRASQPTFGDRASVLVNARSVIAHNSRLEAGVFANPVTRQQFDPKIYQELIDAGLIKAYSRNGDSIDNLTRASRGFNPDSQKVGDFAGAMNGEARAPVDLWRARLAYGKENTPTTKMYEYEFGRNNYLTRMFSAFDPTVMPYHIQAAEWFGYQQLVSERLASIKQAAIATGDPAIIKMAKGIRTNLESKDLSEVFRDYYGLTQGATPPILPFDKILGNPTWRSGLIGISSEMYSRRWLRGKAGAPTRAGGTKELLDIQEGRAGWAGGNTRGLLNQTPKLRHELANYYKTYFVDAKTLRGGPGMAIQSLERNVGSIAERIMREAYASEYPAELTKLGQQAADLLGLHVTREQLETVSQIALDKQRYGGRPPSRPDLVHPTLSLEDDLTQPLAEMHDKFGLPRGLVGLNVVYGDHDYIAQYDPQHPNLININGKHFFYTTFVKNQLAPLLEMELRGPEVADLKGSALAKVKQTIVGYRAGNERTVADNLLGHELGHVIQHRIYGPELLDFTYNAPDHEVLPAAVTLLGHMTPKYMVGLVREGLGNELESLLLAHSSSINEYLGGIKNAPARETVPLSEAVINILEHQTHQWSQFMKVPHSEYSWATPEVLRRSVYEPEVAEANARELGKIYQKALKAISDPLAVEAESQLSGRGANPSVDSSLPSASETSAGVTAYARLPEGNALQSGTSGWLDAGTSDKEVSKLLTLGERMLNIKATADSLRDRIANPYYKPEYGDKEMLAELDAKVAGLRRSIEGPSRISLMAESIPERQAPTEIPWLQKATTQAVARITRLPGEGDKAFVERLVRASGAYDNADHALAVANAARDGGWVPVKYGDKIGFKVGNKFYADTPSNHIANWDKTYDAAIHSVIDNVPDSLLAGEPVMPSAIPGGDIEQLKLAFGDEFKRPAPNVRVGAVSITSKTGEELSIPLMTPHDWRMRDILIPTSKLIARGGGSSNAANLVKAHFEHVQESLDFGNALIDKGIFDPEPVIQEFERLAEGGEGLPPMPPAGGDGGGGEEPPGGKPSKGQTPDERREAKRRAVLANSGLVLRNYLSSLKDSLLIEDPAHRTFTAGLNDLVAEAMKTFDTKEWYKDSRSWIKDANGTMKSFAVKYDRMSEVLQKYIDALEVNSPGANDRIREVMHAKEENRQSLLDSMSPEEAAIANHIHNYWKVMGDVLTRAGVIRTALENYFPLMVERTPEGTTPMGTRGQTHYIANAANEGRIGFKLTPKTMHAIGRIRDEDGHLLFDSPEELQQWADNLELGWKVRTDVAGVFKAQGNSVTQALTMKHTIDQLQRNFEAQIGKSGECAPPILTEKRMYDNPIASLYRDQYVKTSQMIGQWKNALYHRPFDGATREDMWIHKTLAEAMEREASFKELLARDNNIATNIATKISQANSMFKQYKFFFTPVHGYSMLGNMMTHTGFNPFEVANILRNGRSIVRDPSGRRYSELMAAGGPEKGDLGGPAALMQKVPIAGPIFEQYHKLIWDTINYEGNFGLADKLSREYLAEWAQRHGGEVPDSSIRKDADKFGMAKAKEALGNLERMDMSKSWNLWGNVLLLANKWTTGQMRVLGEAFGIGPLRGLMNPLTKLGGAIPLEGHSTEATKFMQERAIKMSQHLVFGGMLRLAILGTVLSTGVSALFNNGVPSTPFENFQRDPNHTFDIYTGRDSVTNRDTWIHAPFFLFQREMIDWAMAAVKANHEGKDFIDKNNWGDSVLAAPLLRFSSKLDPVTRLSIEGITGQEMGQWMAGYAKHGIDSDPNIMNINKSLQMMGVPDGGSLENRLLYGWRSLFPGFGFPAQMPTAAADPGAVLASLGLGLQNAGWQVTGARKEQGTAFEPGPNGTEIPVWQAVHDANAKYGIGQQILAIAETLGQGTQAEEKQKLENMETLRQQANLTPGQLTDILLHGASQGRGAEGLVSLNAAPSPRLPKTTQLNGVTLTSEQEAAYQSVLFQKEAIAMEQAVSDPTWKTMDYGQHQATLAELKSFADRITRQQFEIALGTKQGPTLTTIQANGMLGEYSVIKKTAQNQLLNSVLYKAADPAVQQTMLGDRVFASENAVWEKYYGLTTKLKGASDAALTSYVALQGDLRDEARMLIEKLPSFSRSLDPAAQAQQLKLSLTFADNLVNQAIQGKAPRGFDTPLTRTQLQVALRNGVVLQDAALKSLHSSFIYQEAPQVDQLLLDSKYVTLAHNVALYDTRMGIQEGGIGDNTGFNSILGTTLAADEGYQTLVEDFFGTGGRLVLQQRESELADLKARFRQEYNVAPQDLSKYDTLINTWYKKQNPDYATFLYYRTQWEKKDPLGQAYRATIQSNFGFEQGNPLALSTA